MATFLIVEDDPHVRRALVTLFLRYGECTAASSVAEAEEVLGGPGLWDGFVMDVMLGDGSGLDLLETARLRHLGTPAVIITGALDRETVNRAAELNARFVCKPLGLKEFGPFLHEVLARDTQIRTAIERAGTTWELTDDEQALLAIALRGGTRADFALLSGVEMKVAQARVQGLLAKTKHESLVELTRALTREG